MPETKHLGEYWMRVFWKKPDDDAVAGVMLDEILDYAAIVGQTDLYGTVQIFVQCGTTKI